MMARLSLTLPLLVTLLVAAFIIGGGARSSVVRIDPTSSEGYSEMLRAVADAPATTQPTAHRDLVCNMQVGDEIATEYRGNLYYFCTDYCREAFNEAPEQYLAETCLVCRAEDRFTPIEEDAGFEAVWDGQTYRFCSAEHRDAFRHDPAGYFMHSMWGIPTWLYFASIALVLLLSFGILELRAGHEPSRRPRIDLFRLVWLRKLFLHPGTRFAGQALVVALFLLILVSGLFGNQLPSKNLAPLLTWTIWWGGLIWLVAYAGKAWCYVCPWDAIADWAEGFRFWGKKKEGLSLRLKWPRFMRNIWPATLLFIGLTWIELGFGVTMNPRATAWLGLTMLALAFVSMFVFDRKSFCRYGCLVGRISGLYALFAPVEIRARDREVCRRCTTHSCYTGNGKGEACPTFEFLGTMEQNTYCTSCMECLKTCEKENVALRIRPWGEDLLAHDRPRSDEAYLALLMLSLTVFHGLTMTAAWTSVVGWIQSTLGLGEIAAFSLGMAAVMLAPVAVYALLVDLSRRLAGAGGIRYKDYFVRYAYALLPIALFYHLAHNSEHLLMEGQKVVAFLSDPMGQGWNLLGTAGWSLQPIVNLPTLWILQVFFVMIGHVYSLWAARRAAGALFTEGRGALRSQIPMLAAMILFSVMSLWLLKQPMEMRTSAM